MSTLTMLVCNNDNLFALDKFAVWLEYPGAGSYKNMIKDEDESGSLAPPANRSGNQRHLGSEVRCS